MKSKKNKILFACIMTAILTNCGGGGGGGSAVTVQPSNTGIIKQPKVINNVPSKEDKKTESGYKIVAVMPETNPVIPDKLPANENRPVINAPGIGNYINPIKNIKIKDKEIFIIPTDDKKIDGKGQIVAIMDSDFLTHKGELKNKYKTIEILDKVSRNPNPNGSPHGERVLELMTEDTKFNIVAATIGEKLHSKVFVSPSTELYRQMFAKFGDQKVKVINQSWGVDFKDHLGADARGNRNYRGMLLPLQIVREDEHKLQADMDEINRRGDELMDFYTEAVNNGGLFIWANGNRDSNDQTLNQASLQPSLPMVRAGLEKGWLSVIGVEEKDPVSIAEPNGDYYAYKHYAHHLAYPGYAARWSIAASGDGPESGKGTIGSSYAAPRVARAAALVASKFDWMTNSQVRETLLTTTDKPELKYDRYGNLLETTEPRVIAFNMSDIQDQRYGWGILNTKRALKGPGAFLRTLLERDPGYNYTGYTLYFQANIPEGKESFFENDIYGDSALRKSGKGRLHLTGNNSFSGTTKVSEGTLDIYKNHSANIDIEREGTLVLYDGSFIGSTGYDGHIIGADVKNDGKLIVSNKEIDGKDGIHATIAGNYTVSENGITEIDFDSSLDVLGKADLSQSTIKITTDKYSGVPEKREIIKGNVEDIDTDKIRVDGMRKAVATKENNALVVEMSRENAVTYLNSEYAVSKNTAENVEKILQEIDNRVASEKATADDLNRAMAIVEMSHSEFEDSVDRISGEIYASAQALSFAQSQNINRNISNHLSSLNNFRKSDYEWQGWMSGIHSDGKLKDEGYATGKTKMNGTQFGIDKKISHSVQAGVSLSYSDAEAKFNKYAGVSKSSSLGASIYSKKYLKNDIYVLGRAGVSKFTSKVQRELIDIDGDTVVGNIKHKDYMFSGYLETGKHFANFTPYIGISQDYLRRGSFQENSAAWGINAPEKNYLSTNILLGLRSEYKMNSYTFTGYITHSINVGNRSLNFDGKFTGTDTPQTFKGIDLNKNITWTGIGISKEITPQFNINANLDVRFEGKHRADSVISAGLEYRF